MQMLGTWLVTFQAIRSDGGRCFKGVHLSQVHQQNCQVHQQSKSYFNIARLVHFLLWQAAKPSGDKCTP
ncbi:unknown [Prevotella sp. CAG:520]|nr:unknown [Prevotella sp. CAG:520]